MSSESLNTAELAIEILKHATVLVIIPHRHLPFLLLQRQLLVKPTFVLNGGSAFDTESFSFSSFELNTMGWFSICCFYLFMTASFGVLGSEKVISAPSGCHYIGAPPQICYQHLYFHHQGWSLNRSLVYIVLNFERRHQQVHYFYQPCLK